MNSVISRLKRVGLVAGCLAALSLTVMSPAKAASTEIHVATAYGADNFQTQNLQRYADDVARLTAGKVQMTLHPAGSLLRPEKIFNGVISGEAGAGEVIMSSLEREYPLFGIDALPFIVSGYDDARQLWEASRPAVARVLQARGLQLLYAVPWPPQNLYSREAINAMQDFKGRRLRNFNPAIERIAQLTGALPVTIQVVDLEKAIADGKVDIMLTSSWTGVETKAWTKLRYYYKVSAMIPKNIVFINKSVFDKFDAATRQQMLDAARVAEERGWKMSRESNESFENQLIANKVHVTTLDPLVRTNLDRIGEKLAREWLQRAGNEELSVLLKYTAGRLMK